MADLAVAFIWHMHQPWYVWPGASEAALPFARLHATASYFDMPWLLDDFEDTRVSFNLVPSLIEQIARYAAGEMSDRGLRLSGADPADMNPADRRWLLGRFAMGHPSNAMEQSARYAQLLHKRGLGRNASRIDEVTEQFTTPELRDVQVWCNLAWCGYGMRAESQVVRDLVAKDRNFTEDEKHALLHEMQGFVSQVVDRYRQVAAQGKAELTTSPFYHPILPLLCKMSDATRRIARSKLPEKLWHAPVEANRQLVRARNHHQASFGHEPAGLWPSEGAVSDAALAEIGKAGFTWAASDEEVLAHSLDENASGRPAPKDLCRPWRAGETGVTLLFRDHRLSDLIGFVYRDWAPEDAANDLVGRLRRIASDLPSGGTPPLVCIALDGENPWGWYPDGGERFLRLLYQGIEKDPHLRTVTPGQWLAEHPATDTLASVYPGSWVDHSFGTWIGGDQHRRAWELLSGALEATHRYEAAGDSEAAVEHLMIAEGSDWFWWYSTEHYTLDADLFDSLFRTNVAEVYRLLGIPEPPSVREPIAQTSEWGLDRDAVGVMKARLDGKVSSYFEWAPAALLRTGSLGSAMHRSDFVVGEVYVGHDLESLWLRADTMGRAISALQDHELQFVLENGAEHRLALRWLDGDHPHVEASGELGAAAEVAVDDIVEARVRLAAIGASPGDSVGVAVVLLGGGRLVERWPETGFVHFDLPTADALAGDWLV